MQVELRVKEHVVSGNASIPEWLDEDFLQLCMQSGEGDPTIRVMNHKASIFRSAKENSGAVMYRVSVQFKRRPRSRNILDFKPQETRWLIIKMVPHSTESTESKRKLPNVVQKSALFEREITALSSTVPSISKLLVLFPLAAQCFYSERVPRSLIVMEDLAKNDFVTGKMDTRVRGLDFDHCTLVLQSMAALHAGSVALYEKNKSSMDAYNCDVWTGEGTWFVEDLINSVVSDVADEVASWLNFGDKYADRIRALKGTLMARVCSAVSRHDTFNVLNHGHCWYNNLLFRYNNASSRVKKVLFVDFQNSVFASPVIDLQHFLYSTPTDEVRLQNLNRLVLYYHKELVSNLEKLNVKTRPPTREELIKEMDARGAYSVWAAFTLLPIICDEGTTGTDILKNPNALKERRKMYANEQYKASLKRLLQVFDSKGLLE